MKHYDVVAAIIVSDGKFLCLQRGKTKFNYTSYKWEFPGGKVEKNETEEDAIKREILEEMDLPISVERHIVTIEHEYSDFSITLSTYLCHPTVSEFQLKEHQAFRWESLSKLNELDWAAADEKVVRYVMENF